MAIINKSYEVLSDTEKRKQHNLWIKQKEDIEKDEPISTKSTDPSIKNIINKPKVKTIIIAKNILVHLLKYWLFYILLLSIIVSITVNDPKNPNPGPKPYSNTPPKETPIYVRPTNAPNGEPWPEFAGYVKGYPRFNSDGLSTVTIDNSRNDVDVFVKLVSLDGTQAFPVRQFYISAFGRFTLNNVSQGNYDIRYRDLSNGQLARSETFSLEEIKNYDGTKYSNITMTLYKVQNGNMQTYNLSEEEF